MAKNFPMPPAPEPRARNTSAMPPVANFSKSTYLPKDSNGVDTLIISETYAVSLNFCGPDLKYLYVVDRYNRTNG